MVFLHWQPHQYLIASPHLYLWEFSHNTSFHHDSHLSTRPHFQPWDEELTVLTQNESTSLLQIKGSSKKNMVLQQQRETSQLPKITRSDKIQHTIVKWCDFIYWGKISTHLGIFRSTNHGKVRHCSQSPAFVNNGSDRGSGGLDSVFPLNKINHHLKTAFCICYICPVLKLIGWS